MLLKCIITSLGSIMWLKESHYILLHQLIHVYRLLCLDNIPVLISVNLHKKTNIILVILMMVSFFVGYIKTRVRKHLFSAVLLRDTFSRTCSALKSFCVAQTASASLPTNTFSVGRPARPVTDLRYRGCGTHLSRLHSVTLASQAIVSSRAQTQTLSVD